LYEIVVSCKLNGMEERAIYAADLLARMMVLEAGAAMG
jgi:hypothetical protein